jgi:predicted transcriptional regulator
MINMARHLDYEFRDKLLNYFKLQWMKNGKEPITLSLDEIASGINENKNKIWYYITILERRGSIRVTKRGEGSKPNIYEYVEDKVKDKVSEAREEIVEDIDDAMGELNKMSNKMFDLLNAMSKQNLSYVGEIEHLKQVIADLEYDGISADGTPRYVVKKGAMLPTVLEEIKKEIEAKKEVAVH